MGAVSIDSIKKLRDRTGAGLMDCKNALVATDSDIEKAIVWLKEKGITKVAKKAGRVAAEGRAWVIVKDSTAVIYEVNSETDFVSESEAFGKLTKEIGATLLKDRPAALAAAQELIKPLIADYTLRLGEKLDLRRFEIVTKPADITFGTYIHKEGKIASLIELKGGDQAFADDIAVALTGNGPTYINLSDIPASAIAEQTTIETAASENDPAFKTKPAAIQKKIIEGRVSKLLAQSVFTEQEYVLDATKKVKDVLKEHNAQIVKAWRYVVGEGIEKKEENFAAEVAAQLK